VQTGREIDGGMHLDISDNSLSDLSIRFFADLIGKFSGFRSVNMSNLNQAASSGNTGYYELAKALRENTSLVELDLRHNLITEKELQSLFQALADNHVLSDLKIEVKQRKLPALFSSYPLQSMSEFHHCIENINLDLHTH